MAGKNESIAASRVAVSTICRSVIAPCLNPPRRGCRSRSLCWTFRALLAWDPLVNTNNAIRQPDDSPSEIAGKTFAREAHATKMDVQSAMDIAPPKGAVSTLLPSSLISLSANPQLGSTDFRHISPSAGRPRRRGRAGRQLDRCPA